jgi:hypothetical protein
MYCPRVEQMDQLIQNPSDPSLIEHSYPGRPGYLCVRLCSLSEQVRTSRADVYIGIRTITHNPYLNAMSMLFLKDESLLIARSKIAGAIKLYELQAIVNKV